VNSAQKTHRRHTTHTRATEHAVPDKDGRGEKDPEPSLLLLLLLRSRPVLSSLSERELPDPPSCWSLLSRPWMCLTICIRWPKLVIPSSFFSTSLSPSDSSLPQSRTRTTTKMRLGRLCKREREREREVRFSGDVVLNEFLLVLAQADGRLEPLSHLLWCPRPEVCAVLAFRLLAAEEPRLYRARRERKAAVPRGRLQPVRGGLTRFSLGVML
jgi:hypothetical protein